MLFLIFSPEIDFSPIMCSRIRFHFLYVWCECLQVCLFLNYCCRRSSRGRRSGDRCFFYFCFPLMFCLTACPDLAVCAEPGHVSSFLFFLFHLPGTVMISMWEVNVFLILSFHSLHFIVHHYLCFHIFFVICYFKYQCRVYIMF